MEKIVPPSLQSGDKIRIISTARAVDQPFIDFAAEEIRKRGFQVDFGQNLFQKDRQFAGTDLQRLVDLNEAIRDQSVKAIFCARGGYGTARLVDGIDLDAFKKSPKWICGYSDITALLGHLYQQAKAISIHGTMPVNFESNTPKALNSLFALLRGGKISYSFPSVGYQVDGAAEGDLIGGNLSVIYSILNSPSLPDPTGKILFLEDLDEYLYHVDRMMLNLKRSGYLGELAGIVIGGMTDMNDNTIPFGKSAMEIIHEHTSDLGIPVATGFPAGHIDNNQAWIHGKKIRLTASSDQPNSIDYLD